MTILSRVGQAERVAMQFPVVLHKDKESDYGVTVPDLPGCFSAGRTVDEALTMAQEAIELHLEGLIEDGQQVPEPRDIEARRKDPAHRGGTWALVSIDAPGLRLRAKRINITVPQRVLDAADRFREKTGETRSGLIVRAVTACIGREGDKAMGKAKRGRPRIKGRAAADRRKRKGR